MTFCINELDVGGAEKALVRIAIGLSQCGWNVRVISLRDAGPLAEPLRTAQIPVTALNCGGFADIRTYFRLKSELRANAPDVLCCFLHQANIYGRLAASRANVGIVVSGVRVADRRRWVTLTDRWTRRCVDHYVAVSRNVADLHAQLCSIPPEQITAIPNGVDLSEPTSSSTVGAGTQNPGSLSLGPADKLQAEELDSFRHRLLFVGRLTEQKAPLDLLNAYLLLPDQLRQRTEITFVGEGPLRRKLQQAVDAKGLKNAVRLVGQSHDVAGYMKAATLLVLPSRWEGLPNVVLEAMSHGLPVIATAVDGSKELITEGQTGWLVPPGSVSQLAAKIAEALDRPDLRMQIRDSSQRVAAEGFSWNRAVALYDALFRQLWFEHRRSAGLKKQI